MSLVMPRRSARSDRLPKTIGSLQRVEDSNIQLQQQQRNMAVHDTPNNTMTHSWGMMAEHGGEGEGGPPRPAAWPCIGSRQHN
mmetsp:Transcript_14572/g.36902  ORF Transcript_14572/g.36902 Transcript_14572/m.36902 type:complete len:83 (+) Transcript_14572:458-706(+)